MTDDPLYLAEKWTLDPAVLHLNHGSFGAVPRPVAAEQERWRDQMNANAVAFFRNTLQPALDAARVQVAALLGADRDGLAFVENASTGASLVLAAVPLAEGDEILVTDHVYGSVRFAARKAAARAGASVVEVPVPLDADDDAVLAAVLGGVTARTRLAVLDHIASPTAKLFPVARLIAALRERSVPVLVDAAHAPGQLPVDLGALGADYWTGNFHKWPCAPRGSAGLYAAPAHRAGLGSFPVSWREEEGFPHSFNNLGTGDRTAWLAVPAAFAFFDGLGWDAVRARNAALAEFGQREVAAAIGAELSGLPADEGLSMRLVPLRGVTGGLAAADAVRDRLAEDDGIETAVTWWNDRAFLRVSAQLYNHEGEYERLGAALKKLLAQ